MLDVIVMPRTGEGHMQISARIENAKGNHKVLLRTNEHQHSLTIDLKLDGFGSSVNGGELLFLARLRWRGDVQSYLLSGSRSFNGHKS